MHGTLRGAHLPLRTRTKVLNNDLEGVFRRWYRGSGPGRKPRDHGVAAALRYAESAKAKDAEVKFYSMATLLRIDAETLLRVLVLDPPVSDAEFEALCRDNGNLRFERTKEGAIRMNPPAGGWTGSGNAEIAFQLSAWWRAHKRGRVFDSSTGFWLQDSSILSPDASYLSEDRLKELPKGALRGFPRVCPDFVVELLSESDALQDLQNKMESWIANGAQLGWLIDPYDRRVFVYRSGKPPECVKRKAELAAEGPVAGFVLDLRLAWECYQD